MLCPQCGSSNESTAESCVNCHFPLAQGDKGVSTAEADNPNLSDEEAYKAAIGAKGLNYYLRVFDRFDKKGGGGVSWHWPALFITFFWLIYRKMWLAAFVYFFLPYVVMFFLAIIGGFAGDAAAQVIVVGYLALLAAYWILPPLYANALYYNHIKKKIRNVRASTSGKEEQHRELYRRGGTSLSVGFVVVLFGFLMVAFIGMLAAIAIPQYQIYLVRSDISGAESYGRSAAVLVESYFYENDSIPASLSATGFDQALPDYITEIGINDTNAIIYMDLANSQLQGKTLYLVPMTNEVDRIVWRCVVQDIPLYYLPSSCSVSE